LTRSNSKFQTLFAGENQWNLGSHHQNTRFRIWVWKGSIQPHGKSFINSRKSTRRHSGACWLMSWLHRPYTFDLSWTVDPVFAIMFSMRIGCWTWIYKLFKKEGRRAVGCCCWPQILATWYVLCTIFLDPPVPKQQCQPIRLARLAEFIWRKTWTLEVLPCIPHHGSWMTLVLDQKQNRISFFGWGQHTISQLTALRVTESTQHDFCILWCCSHIGYLALLERPSFGWMHDW
jgi:hypothetical protein